MTKPTDNPRRPSRPTRRFSAMKAPVKRPGSASGDGSEPEDQDEGLDVAETAAPEAATPMADMAAASSTEPDDDGDARVPDAAEAAPPVGSVDDDNTPAPPTPAAAPSPTANAAVAEKIRTERAPSERAATASAKRDDEARIAKVMSRVGVCSRREAEGWILAGRVAVNGAVIASPALNIGPGDAVTVDGYPIEKPEHTRLFMFHKTRGLVTTARDPEGRQTIYDALPENLPRLITVGRLDINTEGLLLLTNDGGLARLLELPSTGWLRRYRVRANGHVDQNRLDALAKGITVEGVDYAGIDAKLDRIQGANVWLTLGLREGKNREVKRVLEHLGLAVTRLIRISFGPFQLGDLAENGVEEVRTRVLRDQLGAALAKQAGLDFRTGEEAAPAVAATPAEPRRKTSRSATADRKGRAVAIERIATVAATPARTARPARRPVADREGGEERSRSPVRAGGRAGAPAGAERSPERAEGRPRTLRQSDAVAQRRESGRAEARDGRANRSDERKPRPSSGAPRSETGRAPGRTRDTERPRTGRNKDEGDFRRTPSRPSRAAAPASARPDTRPPRGENNRPGRGGGDARPSRPSGGSGGDRPNRPGGGGRPAGGAGGGRGRPRG